MKFLYVYRGGSVPEERQAENIRELWAWLDQLKEKGLEKARFAGYGSKVVSQHEVEDYKGDVFGVSIIEANSLEDAIAATADWPELPYGGKIEIFEALGSPDHV